MNNSSFAFASAEEEILTAAKETKANLIVRGAKAPKNLTGQCPVNHRAKRGLKAPCPVPTVQG